jgi:cob(I)alamin adenosyltransferase
MKIYTKTGDTGSTSLFGGERVSKSILRIEGYGTVDELNALLGLACCKVSNKEILSDLNEIQNELFVLGGDLAAPVEKKNNKVVRISKNSIYAIEELIDKYQEKLPELKSFILPGGTEGAAVLHLARTVCRRAERICVELANSVDIGENIVIYLNRLSDLFFVLARFENNYNNTPDIEWKNTGG